MAFDGIKLATVDELVGKEIGVSDWLKIDQQRVDQFAECTDDHQWIHVDQSLAAQISPFGCTIAHGFLTLSLLTQFQQSLGVYPQDAKQVLNYGLNKVRFLYPVKVGDRIRNRVVLDNVQQKSNGAQLLTLVNVIEIEGNETPAMIAEMLVLAS